MAENMPYKEPSSDSSRVETDSQRVVRKHLEDKDHVITEDDIRNVRVGVVPSTNGERHIHEIANNKEAEAETTREEKTLDKPLTPWDVVQE